MNSYNSCTIDVGIMVETHSCDWLVEQHPEVLGVAVVRIMVVLQKISEGRVKETRLQDLDALVVVLDELDVGAHVGMNWD